MYKFGTKSKRLISTCHSDLQTIMNYALSISDVDFGIAEGHRSIEKQKQYYREGKTTLDGVTNKSKHNYLPSMAVDIFPYFNNAANWDNEHMSYLAGLIHAVSEILYAQRRISYKIRWGGNWDMDGVILLDQSFDDRPHFELIS